MKKIKMLNLFSGVGGNVMKINKLAKKYKIKINITHLENHSKTIKVFHNLNKDTDLVKHTVIEEDAKQYLLENYMNFDIIWASPICKNFSYAKFWGHFKKNPYFIGDLFDYFYFFDDIDKNGLFKGKYIIENVTIRKNKFIKIENDFILNRHSYYSNVKLKGTMKKREYGKEWNQMGKDDWMKYYNLSEKQVTKEYEKLTLENMGKLEFMNHYNINGKIDYKIITLENLRNMCDPDESNFILDQIIDAFLNNHNGNKSYRFM